MIWNPLLRFALPLMAGFQFGLGHVDRGILVVLLYLSGLISINSRGSRESVGDH